MPRPAGTVTITMGFNPNKTRIRQMEALAREGGQSLSAYVKHLVLNLTQQGHFVPLHFGESSQVLASLQEEARSLEMSLEDYLVALLADRHRALYGAKKQISLWYPRVQPIEGVVEEEAPIVKEEEIDLGEAMKNAESLMGFYNDFEGF